MIRTSIFAALLAFASAALAQPAPPDNKPDATLRSLSAQVRCRPSSTTSCRWPFPVS